MKHRSITDVQQARAIISAVGEPYQKKVTDNLRSLTYNPSSDSCERAAQQIIGHMETEYVLDIANVLWADRFDDIPQHIKNYS